MAAVDGLHVVAEPHVTGAQVSVHVVQPVGHGVDGVDDEAHLAVLNVVVLQTFITCPHVRERVRTRLQGQLLIIMESLTGGGGFIAASGCMLCIKNSFLSVRSLHRCVQHDVTYYKGVIGCSRMHCWIVIL